MKDRKELIENSKIYFENPEVNLMYATSDGQFFHENALQHLKNYKAGKNISYEIIKRNDLNPVKIEKVEKIVKPKVIKEKVVKKEVKKTNKIKK